MKRALLLEEHLKIELEIVHTGCRSSFSSIISEGLALKRKNLVEERITTKVQLERDKKLRRVINESFLNTFQTTSSFYSSPPSTESMIRELQHARDMQRAENMRLQSRLEVANQMVANQMHTAEQMTQTPVNEVIEVLNSPQPSSTNKDNIDENGSKR